MEEQLVVLQDGRQVERLRIHRELMTSQLDNVLSVDIKFQPVLQLADGVFADRFQSALDLVHFDRIFQLGKFVRRDCEPLSTMTSAAKIAMDLIEISELRRSSFDPLQYSIRHRCQ